LKCDGTISDAIEKLSLVEKAKRLLKIKNKEML
jgi:hypothetical protein